MAIIFNGVLQKPYVNGEVHEVWCNDIKRWPSGNWVCDPSLASLAISHTVPDGGDNGQKIWIAVVDNGYGIVISSPTTDVIDPVTKIEKHTWKREWVSEADEVSIVFVSGIQNVNETQKEYITESKPWVFWIKDQALYAQKLGTEDVIPLVNSNCDSASAIHGFRLSGSSFFNYGLCIFFILSGRLYYRQMIDNVWYDASEVTMGPSGVTWIKVAAGRTWDYRLVIQLLGDDGNVYELYTKHGGIGKLYSDHLEISNATYFHSLTAIEYTDAKNKDEYIVIANAMITAPYGGSYQIGDSQIIKAWNIPTEIEDDETHEMYEDWGIRVNVQFDREINQADVNSQIMQFRMHDSQNHVFYPGSATPDNTGRIFTFIFTNFNNARGNLSFEYVQGTVKTMAGYTLYEGQTIFTPQNLVPVDLPAPVPIILWNE